MISAFVITYNSEKYLRRCLSSLSFVDEILVVDSNSSDGTLRIATEFNTKIIQKEFRGFSEKKEFAKNQCKFDWILNIDADEFIPEETAHLIKESIKSNRYDAYYFPFKTFYRDIEIRYGRHKNERHIRLFKKELKYGDRLVHEKIRGVKNAGFINGYIIHTPYEDISDIRNRAIRNARLSSEEKAGLPLFLLVIFLIFNPLIRFIKEYIFLSGLANGTTGFYFAFYSAKEVYLKYLWGLKKRFNPSFSP